jgi:hypothetical protein
VAQLINPSPYGDTPKVIEDKTRALPANQGLNESVMWTKIDTEIAAAFAASKVNAVESYVTTSGLSNKHGK